MKTQPTSHQLTTKPLAYTIEDASRAVGICRSSIYKLLDSGVLPSVKFGQRRLIEATALEAFLTSLPAAGQAA